MKILIVEPMETPRVAEISGDLKSMQEVVGGYIQAIYPFDEPVALICNEQGKLFNLPMNRGLRDLDSGKIYDVVFGTFFICGAPPESENFESLSDADLAYFAEYYKHPELYITEEVAG